VRDSVDRLSRRFLFMSILTCVMALPLAGQTKQEGSMEAVRAEDYAKLDDFSGGGSARGTAWEGFSDRVMGGVSELSSQVVTDGALRFLRMSGRVSTRNNGGFIQVRLLVGSDFSPFDGARYSGVRLVVRGKGDGYYLHIRTAGMMLPWKYYSAPIGVSADWTTVDIPWSAFETGDFGNIGRMSPGRLKSIAVVAAKKDFDALIELREIGFYRGG
jgi:hypothetical protein